MELVIPVNQMIAFVAIVAFCFLFSRHRLGLSVTFCFTFFWGYIANSSVCLTEIETASPLIILYFVCGIALILLALWSFLVDE